MVHRYSKKLGVLKWKELRINAVPSRTLDLWLRVVFGASDKLVRFKGAFR